jgi:glycosyltransferase involved in cell wall biosynthesis
LTERKGVAVLVLDMSYTLKMFRERQLDQALESRRTGGFFAHVISVHPLAALFEAGRARCGAPVVTWIDDSHVFVEGKLGRFHWPAALAPLNFLLAQADVLRLSAALSRRLNVAVVRIGDPYYLGIIGWMLARALRVPLAIRVPFRYDDIRRVTGRAVMPRLFRWSWLEKRIERFVFRRCDLIAGANEDNMRYAIENGGRPAIATVFRYGNLLQTTHWTEPERRPDATTDLRELGLVDCAFVATVARLEPVKRVEDAIRAVGEMRRRGVAVRALIVGDGTLRAPLEALARSHGVDEAVVFAGARNQEWIARVLPRASVILSPHMGRALTEAALSAVPIVAFDYDWQREVVVDGETGFLVPNGDWEAMADRAVRLLEDPVRARAMGRAARTKVEIMMAPASLVRHEQETYRLLLDGWTRNRARRFAAPQRVSR